MGNSWRYTFGNGVAGQKLADIVRHYYLSPPTLVKRGLCGEPMGDYPIFRSTNVAVRIEKAKVCETCEQLAM